MTQAQVTEGSGKSHGILCVNVCVCVCVCSLPLEFTYFFFSSGIEFIFNVVLLWVLGTLSVIHAFHSRLFFPYRLLERVEQSL